MTEATETQGTSAALEKKDLEYPLNNPEDYKGRIVFNVMKEEETLLGDVIGSLGAMTQAVTDAALSAVTGNDNAEEKRATIAQVAGEEVDKLPVTKRKPLTALGRQISLYLPVGLQFRDTVSYDNMQLGGMGAWADCYILMARPGGQVIQGS